MSRIVLIFPIIAVWIGCGVEASEITPSATPTPIWVVITVTPEPTATLTRTPIPTATPYPTYTPYPTSTAMPTHTALPTYTPYPTYTPLPTRTATATVTPVPTATVTPTPTAAATMIPPTSTPLPTPIPTATRTQIPTPTSTATPIVLPPLQEPDVSTIWGEVELFGLLIAFTENPQEITEKYVGQHVQIHAPEPRFYRNRAVMWLEWYYGYDEPIEREFSVMCPVEKVERHHMDMFVQLETLSRNNALAYVEVTGTIGSSVLPAIDEQSGGLEFVLRLMEDCEVVSIGNKLRSSN